MGTKIEWTEETWNPVTGCTKVSPGCANCYAERMAKRLAGRYGYPADKPFRVTLHPNRLKQPLKWKKSRRVFTCSMSDLFHAQVSDLFIDRVFSVMMSCPDHTFQVLTKRPRRMRRYMKSMQKEYQPNIARFLPHIWLGVTAENQQQADKRIPLLLQIPAAVRFVSVEPMLGPVSLGYSKSWLYRQQGASMIPQPLLDWVIIGCESGPSRRPMELDWARDVVGQCREAGVPVFVKQLDLDGRVSKDPDEWPEDLRVREYPA